MASTACPSLQQLQIQLHIQQWRGKNSSCGPRAVNVSLLLVREIITFFTTHIHVDQPKNHQVLASKQGDDIFHRSSELPDRSSFTVCYCCFSILSAAGDRSTAGKEQGAERTRREKAGREQKGKTSPIPVPDPSRQCPGLMSSSCTHRYITA